jgi:hypothetical protein
LTQSVPHKVFITSVHALSFADFISECRGNTDTGAVHANLRRLKDIQAGVPSLDAQFDMTYISHLNEEERASRLKNFDPDRYQQMIKALKSISVNKSMMTEELSELVRFGRGFAFRQLLLTSSDPKVRASAKKWEEASREGILIGKRILWRSSESKTN